MILSASRMIDPAALMLARSPGAWEFVLDGIETTMRLELFAGLGKKVDRRPRRLQLSERHYGNTAHLIQAAHSSGGDYSEYKRILGAEESRRPIEMSLALFCPLARPKDAMVGDIGVGGFEGAPPGEHKIGFFDRRVDLDLRKSVPEKLHRETWTFHLFEGRGWELGLPAGERLQWWKRIE